MNQYDYLFKFIIIGNTSVGKSCILSKFIDGRFKREHDATIGVEFGSKNIELEGKTIKIQIWDTAGQESFRSITRSYFRGSVGALMVYDITKQESFSDLNKWMEDISENANKHLSVVVMGNKTDLEVNREIKRKEGEKFANEKSFIFFETSAFSGDNIKEAFSALASDVLRRIANNEIDLNDQSCGVKVGQKKGRPVAVSSLGMGSGNGSDDRQQINQHQSNIALDTSTSSENNTSYGSSSCRC